MRLGNITDAPESIDVLALNSGSSSLKFGLYRVVGSKTDMLISGEAESIGRKSSKFRAMDARGSVLISETAPLPSQQDAVTRIGSVFATAGIVAPTVIGHRIVHGGPSLLQHCIIDNGVFLTLEEATPFAPLHIPQALSVIRFAQEHFGNLPQVACFDTAFHANLPDVARNLPIPKELRQEGFRRYGFHGLSCESIQHQVAECFPAALIIVHLGNGASVTAVKDGKSIDTSMGLTPTGGVIMGTRTGDLDPGALVFLARKKKLDADGLEELVNRRSGLLGISGIDSDMRRLHEAASSNGDARLAIGMFCYSVSKQIAAMTAALGGVDAVAFTGGIGENDSTVRQLICDRLSWMGIRLDPARNKASENTISDAGSPCRVHVLPAREGDQIARHAATLLSPASFPARDRQRLQDTRSVGGNR